MENFLNYFKKENELFLVSEIKLYLERYQNLYTEAQKLFEVAPFDFCKSFELKEIYTNELLFTKQYFHLLSFCKISEKEDYFKQELLYYYENQNDISLLKALVIKNREICNDLIYSFLVNYQDDDESIRREFWLVGFNEYWDDSFYFKVCKNEFLNALKFLEIFHELFWDRKVYPEAIEEIEAEIQKLNIVKKINLQSQEIEENLKNTSDTESEYIVLPF